MLLGQLTERDIEILKIINDRRIVSRDHLIYLSGLGCRSQSRNILNKRLRVMKELDLVEKTQPYCPPGQGSYQQLISLGKQGAKYLGIKWKPYFKKIQNDKQQPVLEPPINYMHQLHLVDIEIIIRQKCDESKFRILHMKFEEDNKISGLVPDMFVVISKGNSGRPIYLEMDRGTESYEYIRGKLEKYKNVMLLGEWVNQDWCKIFPEPPFPYIFFVTTGTENRIIQINKMIKEVGMNGEVSHLRDLHNKINLDQSK